MDVIDEEGSMRDSQMERHSPSTNYHVARIADSPRMSRRKSRKMQIEHTTRHPRLRDDESINACQTRGAGVDFAPCVILPYLLCCVPPY